MPNLVAVDSLVISYMSKTTSAALISFSTRSMSCISLEVSIKTVAHSYYQLNISYGRTTGPMIFSTLANAVSVISEAMKDVFPTSSI